jgi:hypothetical protein
MTMQASTLGILEAADFSPKQAHALAQAIEGEIKGSDLVTTPVFNKGIADLRLEISGVRLEVSEMEKRLLQSMVKFGLGIAGITLTAIYFIVLNLRR